MSEFVLQFCLLFQGEDLVVQKKSNVLDKPVSHHKSSTSAAPGGGGGGADIDVKKLTVSYKFYDSRFFTP